MKTQKIILVGDIIGSQKNFNPQDWEFLESAIDRVNSTQIEQMEIPLIIYSGDSFGAVCKDLASSYQVIRHLFRMLSEKIRIVLVQGPVVYGLEKKNFLQLEGPALWKSKELLTVLKKEKIHFTADLADRAKADYINHLLNLILTIKFEWTDKQKRIASAYSKAISQKQIATDMGVSQQYISKAIKKSHCKLVDRSENYLETIWK